MRRRAEESLAPFPGSLTLAASLAAVAGCLDAISLARLTGTFVAFQSGNTVLMGVELGRGHWAAALPTAVAVLTYLLGNALAAVVIRAGAASVDAARRRLFTAATVLLVADAAVVLAGFGAADVRPTGFLRYCGIVAATLAMAMQTPIVRTVEGVGVSTTFSSGMLARLGQSVGDLCRPALRARERPIARILVIVNGCFLGGAVVGGFVLDRMDNLSILVPALALPVIGMVTIRPTPAGGGTG